MSKKNHQKVCAYCNKPYYAANIRGTYCSTNCRVKANRKKCVTFTEKPPVLPSKEEVELQEARILLQQKKDSLKELCENAKKIKTDREKMRVQEQTRARIMADLKKKKAPLVEEYNNLIRGGYLAKPVMSLFKSEENKLAACLVSICIEPHINTDRKRKLRLEIEAIDDQIRRVVHPLEIKKPGAILSGQTMHLIKEINIEDEIKTVKGDIMNLEDKCMELEAAIHKNISTKELHELTDKDGFVSARDLINAKFPARIQLPGDIGDFLGALERKRCAISLSGVPGSGKTYFSFDLTYSFIRAGFTAGYFSMEEGISDLTREKIQLYGLQNEEKCKFRENATLADIHRFAPHFDVIIIDSWGKLNTEIDEFDKLRVQFPETFFIVIFQLTSSKELRGGPKAAYDASVNISTFIENGARYAINKKNRYNKSIAVKYSIDMRKLIQESVD